MAATITTDGAKFRRGVNALAKQYGVEVKQVMLRQVSIVGGQLIKAYPPKNAKIGGQAIQNDLKRVILTVGNAESADIKPVQKVRVYNGVAVIKTDKATLFADPPSDGIYDPNGDQIAATHAKYRNKNTGRTMKRGKWTSKRGNRTAIQNRLIVKTATLNKYMRGVKERIGDLAAGWLATLNIYRGPGAGKAAAKFVSRHAPGDGLTQDQMGADGSGRIVFINRIPYASRWKRQNDFVLRKREKCMAKELAGAVRAAARKAQAVA